MNKQFLMMSLLLAAISCKSGNNQQAVNMVPEVKVVEIAPQLAVLNKQYPANIVGQNYVGIMPRVSGYVSEIVVDEGSKVKKGQVVIRISKDNYIQDMRTAQAAMNVSKVAVETAKLDLEKSQSLFDNKIVSKFDLEDAKLNLSMKTAQYEQSKAAYDNAVINLEYTDVKSPIDGVIGTYSCFVGTLVGPSNVKPITTVSSMEKMRAYFSISDADYTEMLSLFGKSVANLKGSFLPTRLILANGKEYSKEGKLDVISGVVDPTTGSVSMRATFDNDGMLHGGSSGYIILPEKIDSAIVIPQSSTITLQDKILVYTVKDSSIVSKFIKINSTTVGKDFVVMEGLSSGDVLVIENITKLREGMKVSAKKD